VPPSHHQERFAGRGVRSQARTVRPAWALGARPARSVAEVARAADIVCVSLPSGRHLQAVCEEPEGLIANVAPGRTVVDLGTSPLKLSRELAARFAAGNVAYADAPVAARARRPSRGRWPLPSAPPNRYSRTSSRCFGASRPKSPIVVPSDQDRW
jgi:3-hydroxyisobutyrate dehydrogenase-like beta-hydroxyacid dehydrogenase